MDNLAEAVKFGYITDKEAQLLELLDMPARDAKPPKGVPKTHVPKRKGKSGPKETLKKLSPKQKATLKAKTDGKVDKTKDGVDSFYMEGSASGKNTGIGGSPSSSTASKSPSSGSSFSGGGKMGSSSSQTGGAKASPGSQGSQDSGGGGRDDGARDSVGANAPSGGNPSGGSPDSRDGGARAPVGANKPSKSTSPGSYDGPARHDPNGLQGAPAANAYGGFPNANNAAYLGSKPTTVTGVPSTPGNLAGKADRENVTTVTQNGSIINKTDPDKPYGKNTTDVAKAVPSDLNDVMPAVTKAERAIIGQVKQPTSFARLDSPSALADLGPSGSMFESPNADRPGVYNDSELNDIVGGKTPARANAATREAYADNVSSDPTAGQTNSSLASIAGNPEKTVGRVADNTTLAGGVRTDREPSTASVEAARSAILGDVAQAAGTPTAGYDPLATAAGTITAPYNPPTQPAALTGSPATRAQMPNYGAGPAQDVDLDPQMEGRLAETKLPGYGVPDVPKDTPKGTDIGKTDAETSLASYEKANAIPGVTPAVAAGTLTTPYNAKPDSPLSPLATVKTPVAQVNRFAPPPSEVSSALYDNLRQQAAIKAQPAAAAVAAGTLTGPYNTAANDNVSELQGVRDSTTADQNMPNTSTIADQSLPGGLPSAPTGGGPTFGQGGQGGLAQPAAAAPPPAPPPVTPPPVVEQTDPYAGIMPWDHIAYDAIKASVEASGQTYTPAQFIASFYNQKKAA